jgi:peroxiredoxin 2/4
VARARLLPRRLHLRLPDGDHGVQLGRLAFPLAADATHTVSRAHGVLIEDEGIARRGLFIIDPEGVVRYQVVYDDNVGRSVVEALRVQRALRAETRVPADWHPGDATLSA